MMIIFDLGCLSDDSHRRHLIQEPSIWIANEEFLKNPMVSAITTNPKWKEFHSDWQAYYDACDGDSVIESVMCTLNLIAFKEPVEIWSSNSESVREKIYTWFNGLYNPQAMFSINSDILKLRPIGDDRPQEQLFEDWADLHMFGEVCEYPTLKHAVPINNIDMAFSSHKPTIDMFRARGIFVFDCNQGLLNGL